MTSRRWMLPRTWRRSLRRAVRLALHIRPARPAAPPRGVAPAIVASVAAVVGLVIATGGAAEARGLAARPVAAAAPEPSTTGGTLASAADIARAVNAVDPQQRRSSARASRSSSRAPLHRWVRPNYGPLSSPFGYRWGRLHAGIDLAGPYGSPILAATDGCITYAGPEMGYGEVMKITDWDGTATWYGHMSAFVKTSGCVKAGQEIARVGAAGDATGAHLHFEVHVGGVPVDPIPFLAKRGVHV